MSLNNKRKTKSLLSFEDISKLYLEGNSTTEISNLANVSDRYIRSVLTAQGIEKRAKGSWKRKFKVNEHYFKTWNSEMAYILGFLSADGCIVSNQQTVSFAQKEKYLLEEIKSALESEHPIIVNSDTGVFILNIHSKIMKDDLVNLHGITPKKSRTLKFPDIPEEYVSHFIRGYFDGDGYVSYRNFFISIVGGSIQFMNRLKEIFEQKGFEPNFTSHETHYRVYVSGRKTIKEFSNWIYQDKNICLIRKYNEFMKEEKDISVLKNNMKIHRNALSTRMKESGTDKSP